MGIEHIDDFGEIGERPGQAVDLVDDDDLDLASFDIGEEPLQCRPLHGAAREASVVIHFGERDPAGMPLARDLSLTRFALSVERVKFLLQPVIR